MEKNFCKKFIFQRVFYQELLFADRVLLNHFFFYHGALFSGRLKPLIIFLLQIFLLLPLKKQITETKRNEHISS